MYSKTKLFTSNSLDLAAEASRTHARANMTAYKHSTNEFDGWKKMHTQQAHKCHKISSCGSHTKMSLPFKGP